MDARPVCSVHGVACAFEEGEGDAPECVGDVCEGEVVIVGSRGGCGEGVVCEGEL